MPDTPGNDYLIGRNVSCVLDVLIAFVYNALKI